MIVGQTLRRNASAQGSTMSNTGIPIQHTESAIALWRYMRVAVGLVLCLVLAGCASTRQPPSVPSDSGALAAIAVGNGQTAHVEVLADDAVLREDLASMLVAYLQSERGLNPVEHPADADIRIVIRVDEIFPLGRSNAPMSGGRTLAGAATGTALGVMLGNAVGGGRGAAWGAGAGLLLGLGTVFLDSQGKYTLWGMRAEVGIGTNGRAPDEESMQRVEVRAEGANMDRQEILPALEDRLCMEIVNALQP